MGKSAVLAALLILLTACAPPQAAQLEPPADSPPPTESIAVTPLPTDSPPPEPEPEPSPEPDPYDYTLPVPEGEAVDDDWFDNAVFIGDSRTDGMHKFSGLKTPTYLHYTGLTVFDFSTRAVIPFDGETCTAQEALAALTPQRVYLCLGLNELGWRNDDQFFETYGTVVDTVRELHPDAQIYLQLLIPVNSGKCKANNQPAYVTNAQIDIYNGLIARLAAEKEVYWLNLPEVFAGEDGELPREMTGDGVHMTRAGYALWADYLRTHAVVREEDSP